jgi:hypothetical protein
MNKLSPFEINELFKCSENPVYFINTYLLKDFNIKLNQSQEKLVLSYNSNKYNYCIGPEQSGKSLVSLCYILYYSIFNDYATIGIFSYNQESSKLLLKTLHDLYSKLPDWLKLKIIKFNKKDIEFVNFTKIIANKFHYHNMRGWTFNILYIEGNSSIAYKDFIEFTNCVFPMITSRENTKIMITTEGNDVFNGLLNTPNNLFVKTELI